MVKWGIFLQIFESLKRAMSEWQPDKRSIAV